MTGLLSPWEDLCVQHSNTENPSISGHFPSNTRNFIKKVKSGSCSSGVGWGWEWGVFTLKLINKALGTSSSDRSSFVLYYTISWGRPQSAYHSLIEFLLLFKVESPLPTNSIEQNLLSLVRFLYLCMLGKSNHESTAVHAITRTWNKAGTMGWVWVS